MKKMTIEVKKIIAVAPGKVWPTIAKANGLKAWFPLITACRVEGNQRYCSMQGGGDLQETIISTDNATRTFTYSVDKHPLPWGPAHCTLKVNDAGMSKSEIIWTSSFECNEEVAAQATEMMNGLYGQGIDALEAFHKMAA
ncbi:MAG: SRPBCC family protein [Pseudomonadota bacterium]|nr:SRPBCC family protein [Pseudomonadota bacterium]